MRAARHAAAIGVVLAVLASAACTRAPGPDSAPSVGGPAPAQGNAQSPDPLADILMPQGQAEYTAAIAECMAAAGFANTVSGDRITYEPTPSEQRSQFEAASAACSTEALERFPVVDVPITDALLLLNYERNVAAKRCLEENGLTAPELGSYQEWVEDLYAGDDYNVMEDVLAGELSGGPSATFVERTCPAPARFFLDPVTPIYDDEVDYEAYRRADG